MKGRLFRSFLYLAAVVGAYVWFDPGHPSDEEARAAIQRVHLIGMTVDSVEVERSFMGRRPTDTSLTRVWPVTASTRSMPTADEARAPHEVFFFVWRNSYAEWQAELDGFSSDQWEHHGYFGVFGL